MKSRTNPPSALFSFLRAAFLCVLFCAPGIPAARAGLTIEMQLVHYSYGNNYYYYFFPILTTNNTPPLVPYGDYLVTSPGQPTNGANAWYHFDTNGFNQVGGGAGGFNNYDAPDFNDSFIQSLTNGNWTISVTNASVTNNYYFHVTANISSNSLPPVVITFPTNGAVNVTNQPTYTWEGPTNYSDLVVYQGYNSPYLPVTQTNWPSPNVLYEGLNSFTAHYDSNSLTAVVCSVPLDTNSNPISSWVSTCVLQTYFNSQFSVGTVDLTGTSHTLVAHFPWDTTNADGTASGADTSGNGYDMDTGGSFGSEGGVNSTTIAAAGPFAIQFEDGDNNSGGFVGWSTTPPNILSALAGSFSVSCWINTTQNSIGSDTGPAYQGAGIVSADNNGLTDDLIPIALTGDTIGFNTGGQVEDVTLNSVADVNDGNYHHVVVTRNQQTGQKIIYIDGVMDSFSSGTTDLLDAPQKLTIGSLADASNPDPNDGSNYNGYNGELDDLQIYSGVLSAADVATLYAYPGSTLVNGGGFEGGHTNIVYYSFEDDNLFAEDFSGHGNNVVDYSWFDVPPYITNYAAAGSYAVGYTGSGWQDLPTNVVTTLSGSFSVSLWASTTNIPGNDTDTADQGAGLLSANADQVIPMAQTGNKLAFLTGGSSPDTLHSVTSINTGHYVHLVVTRDQDSGEKRIYVNGALDATDVGVPGLLGTSSQLSLLLGMNSTFSGGLIGDMDEVQIYSGVLSPTDVAYLYSNSGRTVPDTAGQGTGTVDFNGALGTTNLNWSTSGDSSWFIESTNTSSGSTSAAQSGPVTSGESSTLAVTVTGPGTLTFDWSSIAENNYEGFDYAFFIDGNYADNINGDTPWYQDGPFTIPAGQHTLTWVVFANADSDTNEVGFLDQVSYVPDSAPVITLNPFSQTNYPGYQVGLLAAASGYPAPTWQWFEIGNANPVGNGPLYIPSSSGTAAVAGSYYAVASNYAGSVTTLTATVTFVNALPPPTWTTALKSPFSVNDFFYGSVLDSAGNIYAAAEFSGTNVVGTNTAVAGSGGDAAAIVKESPAGANLWFATITNAGNGNSRAVSVALAPADGVYVSGYFVGTNWLGTNALIDGGSGSIFLALFDVNGNNLWTKAIGGTGGLFTSMNCLVADPSGNVTLSGVFSGTVNFGGTNVITANGQQTFLAQYNAAGALNWVFVPSGWFEYLSYSSGRIYGAIMNNQGGASVGSSSINTDRRWTLAALNSTNGQAIWLEGVGAAYGQGGPSVIDDIPGVTVSGTNVFVVGTAYGPSATFGSFTVTNGGASGQYFARYDTNGTPHLALGFGSQTTRPWAVAANASGDVYASGDFDTVSEFGSKVIAAARVDAIGSDYFGQAFVAKFDSNGNVVWANLASSTSLVNFRGVAVAPDGVWVSGFCKNYTTFGTKSLYSNVTVEYSGSYGFLVCQNSGILAKITDVGTPPVITQNLTSETNECGSYFNLTVTATNAAPMYYQWYLSGTNPIANAVNPILGFYPGSVAQSGNYSVVVEDAYGSVTSSVAALTVEDTTPPSMTLYGDAQVITACPDDFVDPGAYAYDECAGVLPVTISGSLSHVPGTNILFYVATDPSGNSTTNTRTVIVVTPTVPPVISLIGANPMQVLVNSSFVDPGQKAVDFCGNTLSVTASGSVNPNLDGTYTLTYTTTDAHGLSSTNTRTVIVENALQCVPALSGLISWWTANGNAQDVLGAHNGTLEDGAAIVPGYIGDGFGFNGTNSYVDLGAWTPGSTWTIEAWVNPASLQSGRVVIAGDVDNCHDWALVLNNGQFAVASQPPGGCGQSTAAPVTVVPGTWYHVAATSDGTNASIYVNGIFQASAPVQPGYVGDSTDVRIGGDVCCGENFSGVVDEVAIYNRALSATEIGNIENAGTKGRCSLEPAIYSFSATSGVVGNVVTVLGTNFYNVSSVSFNGTPAVFTVGSGGELGAYVPAGATTGPITVVTGVGQAESSGSFTVTTGADTCFAAPSGLTGWWPANGNALDEAARDDGTLENGVTYAPGEVGQAFSFDGVDGYVFVPASTNLNIGAGPGLSIEGWIDPTSVSGTQAMVQWYGQFSYGVEFWISTSPGAGGTGPGCLYANLIDTNGNYHQFASGPGLVVSNVFQHVGLTYDQTSGLASLYLNGALVAQQNLGSFTPQTTYDLYFGVSLRAGNYFSGRMDDFSIYNRSLLPAEIGSIYNAGALGKCPVAPGIIQQPTPVSLNEGLNAVFSVTANGTPPLQYQWYQGTLPLTNSAHVSGATNSSLTLAGLTSADVAQYWVQISNNYGSTNSEKVQLSVTNDFDLQLVGITGPPQAVSGEPMEISWSVTNRGAANFNGTFHEQVSLSPNAGGSNSAPYATFDYTGTIPPGQAVALSGFITPNINLSGYQWIVITTDANGLVPGGNGETNNTAVSLNAVDILLQPLPSVQVSYVTVPPSAVAGQPVTITWGVTNAGDGGTSDTRWTDGVWLSADGQIDITSTFLANVPNTSFLNAGASYANSLTVTLPLQIQGNYYFVIRADDNQNLTERQRTNDTLAGGPTLVQLPPLPSLQASIAAPPVAFSGQSASLSWTVVNGGVGATQQGSWLDFLYLSTTNVFDASAVLLTYNEHIGALASGQSYSVTNFPVSLPVGITGTYYFIVVADGNQQVYQLSRQQDTAVSSPATQVLLTPPPDMAVGQISAPTTIYSAHTFTATNVVSNVGASATPNSSWFDNYYLSPTSTLNLNTAIFLTSYGHYPGLATGQSYTNIVSLSVPDGLTGTYYLIVDTDAGNNVFELDKTNNIGFDPIPIQALAPLPDLVITRFTAPTTVPPGTGVNVSWTVQNRGTIDTAASFWSDDLYLSASPTGSNPIGLGNFGHSGLLNPGDSYTVTNGYVTIPYGLSHGTYYLFVKVDSDNSVYLGSNTVDQTSSPLAISLFSQPADLNAGAVTAPESVVAGNYIKVTWAVTNLGPGQTYASYWNDSIYLSTNSSEYLSTNSLPLTPDLLLGNLQHVNDLFAGDKYTNSLNVLVPATVSGNFTLYVLADSGDRVVEDDVRSNNVAFPTNLLNVLPAAAIIPPDLTVGTVTAPAQAFSGQGVSITYSVTNNGPGSAIGSWYDAVYLSPDPFLDTSTAFYLGSVSQSGDLTNGASYTRSAYLPIRPGLSGYFYVFVVADAGNFLDESQDDNDTGYAPDAMLVSIPAPANLVVTSVQTPVNSVVGELTTISYTVSNESGNTAQGTWTDAIYLSTNGLFNAGDVLIGYVQETGPLGAGSNYTGSLTVDLPGVTSGNYYVVVQPDGLDNLNENVGANHSGSTTNTFAIDVSQLTLDVPETNEIVQGQKLFYKVYVPAGQSLSVALNSDLVINANQLYVRYGAIPSEINYDFLGGNPSSPNQEITVPTTQAGWYYILAVANSVGNGSEKVSLEASLLQFSLNSILPISGGNAGNVTVDLQGGRFNAQTTAALVKSGATVVTGTTRNVASSADMFATFNLVGVPTGLYDVQLSQPGSPPALLPNAFTVTRGLGATLSANIKIPGAVRPGFFYAASLNYENSGNQDLPAPLLVITNSQNWAMSLSPNVPYTKGTLEVLGIAQSGPAGVLPPGTQYVIPIYFQVPTNALAHSLIQFQLSNILPNATPVDWSGFAGQPPAGLTPFAWSAMITNIETLMGPDASNFIQTLDDNATFYSLEGRRVYDLPTLFSVEMNQAVGFFGGTHMIAETLDAASPSPLLALNFGRIMPTILEQRLQLGLFGWGWSDNFEISLSQPATNIVDIAEPDGTHRIFTENPDQSWQAYPGDPGILQSAGGGTFTLLEKTGILSRFDSSGRLISIQEPNGNQLILTYNNAELTTIRHSSGRQFTFGYNSFGRIATLTDSAGRVVQYNYDATGQHLLSVVLPGNVTTSYSYLSAPHTAADNALQTMTLPDGTHQYYAYDNLGRLNGSSQDGGLEQFGFGYSPMGGVFVTNAAGAATSVQLGERGQILQVTDPIGHTSATGYDTNFNLVNLTWPAGQVSLMTYDTNGNNLTIANPLGQLVQTTYTNLSRLSSVHDQLGHTTLLDSDGNGNITSIIYPDQSAESLAYDAVGSFTNYYNRRGQLVQYAYDQDGQIVQRNFPDGRVIGYQYDAIGHLTNLVDSAQGTTALQYDPRGYMTNITYPDGHAFSFAYSNVGQRTRRAGSDGYVINYGYDSIGRLSTVSDGSSNLLVQYGYNTAGRLGQEIKGNGTTTAYTYDLAGHMTELTNYAADGSVQSFYNYTLDANGNRLSMTTTAGTTLYQYDALNQLTAVEYPGGREVSYTYDAAGNRVSVNDTGTNTAYTVNSLNQYNTAGATTLSYDADGNLTNRTDANGTTAYQYDAENRLLSVSTPSNGVWQYAYNGFDQRITAVHDGLTTHYLLDPGDLVDVAAEYDDSGSLIARYNDGIGLVSRVDGSGNSSYYAFDALGNVRALTGTNGAVENSYDYDAYGAVTMSSETVPNEFKYIGRYGVMDETNTLHFMRGRFYSAKLGRFQSVDPIRFAGGINLQTYANNNPVRLIDPVGLQCQEGDFPEVDKYEPPDDSPNQTRDGADLNTALQQPLNLSVNSPSVAGYHIHAGALESQSVKGGFSWSAGLFGGATAGFGPTVGAGVGTPPVGLPGGKLVGAFVGPAFLSAGYSINQGIAYFDIALEADTPQPVDTDDGDVLAPGDPNLKTGPLGYGPNALISASQPIPYTITFVNASSNSAPAHTISVTDQLDPNIDPRTFRLTEIVFGTNTVQVPANSSYLQTNLTISTVDGPVIANVIASVDVVSGQVFWSLTTIDPATGQSPSDPLKGLLPPDDANHAGEGRVSYTVSPYTGVATGTSVTNSATITFDINPPITTPAVVNMLDAGTPESQVVLSTNVTLNNVFTVSWAGTDNNGSSGLAGYNVYVSDDGGPFQLWLANTTLTSALYTGQSGHTYNFYSIAMDNAGNVQVTPSQPQNTVFVSTNLPPVIAPIPNLVVAPSALATVKVIGSDPNGDQLTYSLGGNPPVGASIIPTNGLFRWQPTRADTDTTNLITVVATDNGVPPLSTSQTFTVTVLDYLELDLGSTNVYTGQSATLPLTLASSDKVTNLVFTVKMPPNLLTNWTVVGTLPQVASATVQNFVTNIVVALVTVPGQPFQGTQQIAQLSFLAVTNQHSSFISLPVIQITGNKPNSAIYSDYITHPGLVAVVDKESLLLATITNDERALTIFGRIGTNYQVQFNTNLALPTGWQPLFNYTQTNSVISTNVESAYPVIFYRLLEQ